MLLHIDVVCYLFYLIYGAVHSKMMCLDLINRRTLICAVNQDAEKLFQKTVEVDRLIDMLRDANANEVSGFMSFLLELFSPKPNCNSIYIFFCEQLQKFVVENVLAFNEGFWIRLAARTDTCKSEDDKACF